MISNFLIKTADIYKPSPNLTPQVLYRLMNKQNHQVTGGFSYSILFDRHIFNRLIVW